MENVSIKIHNYLYIDSQINEIKKKLEVLNRQIPYNSFVKLDISYKGKVFYGQLKVDCDGKNFFSKNQNKMLISLVASLCKKTQKQIMKWKKTRTLEEITGVIYMGSSPQEEENSNTLPFKKAS